MRTEEGLLRKGIGGFYYVEAADTIYECKARGIFRKTGITPLAGDRVAIGIGPDGTCTIDEIRERKNFLARPPISNLDFLFLVASVSDPAPNTLLLDKMIAAAEEKGIEPVVVVSKTDLHDGEDLRQIYTAAGIRFFAVSSVTGEGVDGVRALLKGKISAFTGNSGVGKSSLLNRICPELKLKTGEISRKLGRGRHTTRQVELLKLDGDTYVADTPGFSSIDVERGAILNRENLPFDFREFRPYLNQCRFASCSHTCEKGCAVIQAVRDGKIHSSRYENYAAIYEEIKKIKDWQLK